MYYLQSKLRAGKGTFGIILSKKCFLNKNINEIKNKITTLTQHFQIPIEKSMVEAKSTPQIHNHTLFWLAEGISIKCGGAKLGFC